MKKHLLAYLVVFGAVGCDGDVQSDPGPNADAGVDAAVDAAPPEPDAGPAQCGTPADLSDGPLDFEVLTGFSGAEDFVFDAEGYLVSVDRDGNLTRQPKEGDAQLITPGFHETAGTRRLSGGDYVIADVADGALVRVTPQGAKQTLATGLQYPNGVEVSDDDVVYVAEQNAGQVREINPETGANTIIATGLFNPNGVALSPDQQILYVGSFGGGTVHQIRRDGDGWAAPVLLAQVSEPQGGLCENVGDACEIFGQQGRCEGDEETGLYCQPDGGGVHGSCETEGAACGESDAQLCISVDDALICPYYGAAFVAACVGKAADAACQIADVEGTCSQVDPSDGFTVCVSAGGRDLACAGKAADDACVDLYAQPGRCVDGGAETGLFCNQDGGQGAHESCDMLGAPCGDADRICISANDELICPMYAAAYVSACADLAPEAACTVFGVAGVCSVLDPSDGFSVCFPDGDVDPGCADRAEGDACTDLYGHRGQCHDQSDFGLSGLFCFSDDLGGGPGGIDEDSCDDLEIGDRCTVDGQENAGICEDGADFGLEGKVCVHGGGIGGGDIFEETCGELQEGDRCTFGGQAEAGTCVDGEPFGAEGLVCTVEGLGEGPGGLDGVMVDACGNVYVTEYTTGKIYRVSPDGQSVDVFVKLPSPWIPNMRWGNGQGGFEADIMYIMDREDGRLFTVRPGVGAARK